MAVAVAAACCCWLGVLVVFERRQQRRCLRDAFLRRLRWKALVHHFANLFFFLLNSAEVGEEESSLVVAELGVVISLGVVMVEIAREMNKTKKEEDEEEDEDEEYPNGLRLLIAPATLLVLVVAVTLVEDATIGVAATFVMALLAAYTQHAIAQYVKELRTAAVGNNNMECVQQLGDVLSRVRAALVLAAAAHCVNRLLVPTPQHVGSVLCVLAGGFALTLSVSSLLAHQLSSTPATRSTDAAPSSTTSHDDDDADDAYVDYLLGSHSTDLTSQEEEEE